MPSICSGISSFPGPFDFLPEADTSYVLGGRCKTFYWTSLHKTRSFSKDEILRELTAGPAYANVDDAWIFSVPAERLKEERSMLSSIISANPDRIEAVRSEFGLSTLQRGAHFVTEDDLVFSIARIDSNWPLKRSKALDGIIGSPKPLFDVPFDQEQHPLPRLEKGADEPARLWWSRMAADRRIGRSCPSAWRRVSWCATVATARPLA